jgi:hypothetical protein
MRLLEKAWEAFRQEAPGSTRELAVTLGQIDLAARAVRDRRLARGARKIGRRISKLEVLQTHRELLSRVRHLGLLPTEAATGLEARWEELSRDRARRALRKTRGRPMRRLRRALRRRGNVGENNLGRRLEQAYKRHLRRLEPPGGEPGDGDLSRYRAALRTAKDAALALADVDPARPRPAERESRIGAALDQWHDLRSFRKTLSRERRRCERRGSVTLAFELDGLISMLDRTLARARREALRAARTSSNVLSFNRRSA